MKKLLLTTAAMLLLAGAGSAAPVDADGCALKPKPGVTGGWQSAGDCPDTRGRESLSVIKDAEDAAEAGGPDGKGP